MFTEMLLLLCGFLLGQSTYLYLQNDLPCLHPLRSSIDPCLCRMRPYFDKDRVFLSSFEKTVSCILGETFSFARIAEAFDHDNHIDKLIISGHQAGDFFLAKEDLGRLNVSELKIRSELSRGQQILENGARDLEALFNCWKFTI